ncbi:AraC family transcriptional regulator [Planococcus dechangensis]|uniref:GyrI-like domain-containing protein n=1 Tax=Planococcus dechangensis TaxID=1176255 RepID=A0ABV9MA40_9BACL
MLKQMNEALAYIEAHLDGEIDEGELERIAGTSIYHFRRMFSFLSGFTLGEYIRKRRLSNAVSDLHGGMGVMEAALTYGYDSADGFSRAFKEWSGISPSAVQKSGMLKSFPKLSFQLTVQGGVEMEYRIEEKQAFNIVGKKKRVAIQFEGENKEIAALANSITAEQREEMRSYANMEPQQIVNASFNFDEGRMDEKGALDHMLGFLTTKNEEPGNGLDKIQVPALTWAVFTAQGEFPRVMQETWGKIVSEWLPSSGYELAEAPEISFTGDLSDPAHVKSEIWMAVKKPNQG